jgi:hypothetical protein
MIAGIRVTSAARTVLDLARTTPFDSAVATADAALHNKLTTRTSLDEQLLRLRPGPGSRDATTALSFADGRSDSPGESLSRVAFHHGELPTPHLQARISDEAGNFVADTDFLFETLGVIGEFDGRSKYQAGLRRGRTVEEVVIAEKYRENRIRALGWIVARWTWADLENRTSLVARIEAAAAVAARTPHRAGTWNAPPRI